MPIEGTQKFIMAFVTLLLGIAFLVTIAGNTNAVSELSGVSAESITLNKTAGELDAGTIYALANQPTVSLWKSQESACDISNFVLSNTSGTAFTVTTDYVINTDNGTFYLVETDATENGTADDLASAAYNYCGDDYLTQGWSRSIIDLIAGFFALALMGVSLGLFYSLAKDYGLL
jgi:hypothetical protein